MKVGYQGIKGCYSEAAIYKHFGKNIEASGFETSEDVIDALKNERIDSALLPFENTIAGSIALNYDLTLKEDLFIVAEVFYKVRHNLLSNKGSKLNEINRAYSHPHALIQCREFLRAHNIKAVPEYDTAGAAKIVKERGRRDEAAIASSLCAEIYHLDVLESSIESNKINMTKFFVIVKKDKIPNDIKKEKTSVVFKTKHYPGALVNCLERLAKNKINLTKLESRPIPENPWEYVFYADFEGGIDDERVKLALSEMEATSIFVKVVGSYPKAKNHI